MKTEKKTPSRNVLRQSDGGRSEETLRRKRLENVIGFNAEVERDPTRPGGMHLPRLLLDGVEIAHAGVEVKFSSGSVPVLIIRIIPKSLSFITDATKAAP